MLRKPLREKIQYITPDGIKYTLHDPPNKGVYNLTGVGVPAPNYRDVSGPFQHGARVLSGTLEPRTLSFSFMHNGNTRSTLWDHRDTFADVFRSNRTSDSSLYSSTNLPEPGQLRFYYLQNNVLKVRDIDVYLTSDITYKDSNEIFAVQEDLVFTAFNPIFYDPTPVTVVLDEGLNLITYTGTWEEYPTITVDGVVEDFSILNTDTGYYLDLQYTSGAGEIITFDLSYGLKDVYNNADDPLLSYLTLSSNLINFSLQPDPVVTDGENLLQVAYDSGTPTITLTYYNRYLVL